MKTFTLCFVIIIFLSHFSKIYALENPGNSGTEDRETVIDFSESVRLPLNVYDKFTFSESTAPYVRNVSYVAAPGFMLLYGIYLWNWDLQKQKGHFELLPQHFWGSHAVDGGADKFGHMNANYMGTRLMTFLFRATGVSKNRAIIQAAIVDELVALIGEVGDGYSPHYGFDPYDVLFNNFGILLGSILEYSPLLDRMFTMRWEYFPAKRIRDDPLNTGQWDITTDYNDEKYMLTTKLAGIPYVSLTPLRYLNIDIGYYSRGYRPAAEYPSRTRHLYVGISINFSAVFGDHLPTGYASSTLQTLFNYYSPPCSLIVKDNVLSDKPHSAFKE